ncbi:DUF5133 domain-containing protein [Streptomyces kunmingensis]|uniref:DUF5133 domain-containing protein n=1 Tax=Streptomyces kunmingensis TaxID=68225 RepID=A0ABU6C9Z5_9ACTN|nr:DUF5133 domain-containing protein [Streptomyces kunmingensis]MEB3961529.1 DUF5133 domain-containing protein [Streptomyces kunmingensis]
MTALLPTASDLRQALVRHADAVSRDERRSTDGTVRAREDSAYTLCVLTGTRDVEDAQRVAEALLSGSTALITRLRPVAEPVPPVTDPVAAPSGEEKAAGQDRAALADAA